MYWSKGVTPCRSKIIADNKSQAAVIPPSILLASRIRRHEEMAREREMDVTEAEEEWDQQSGTKESNKHVRNEVKERRDGWAKATMSGRKRRIGWLGWRSCSVTTLLLPLINSPCFCRSYHCQWRGVA